jgi:hypothetical protein
VENSNYIILLANILKMKFLQLFILPFLFQTSYSQNVDLSHRVEIEGWKYYFEGKKQDAKQKFVEAIKLDSNNNLAKIGLVNSKTENELSEKEFELIDNLPKDNKKYSNIMSNLIMLNQIDKELPNEVKIMRNKYDEAYNELKAALTDSDFTIFDEEGNIRKEGGYRNLKQFGTWKVFGYQNKLNHSYTFPLKGDTVFLNYYKSDGDIIKKVWLTGVPFTNDSKTLKEVIFWQENPGQKPGYLFVSKEGFKIYDSENPVEFDEKTPDNFIQRIWNSEKKTEEAFIWKNGKRQPYKLCENDGIVVEETVDGSRKTYRWENCEKILIKD